MSVCEELRKRGLVVDINATPVGVRCWSVDIYPPSWSDDVPPKEDADYADLPAAICKAALAALDASNERTTSND